VRDEQVGFVAPQEDPAALAEALREALATPAAERAAMGERARALATRAFATESSLPWWRRLFRDLRG
jgi:glycosyltransferase involved in cell wall biosynthesis